MSLEMKRRATPTRFRYEADMVPLLRGNVARIAFGTRTAEQVHTFTEVPAVHGVPDVTAVRFDESIVARRRAAGVRPLTTDTEVSAILSIGSRSSVEVVAQRMRTTTDYVRKAVLPLLEQAGWVTVDGGEIHRIPEAGWVGRRVVTVEAKRRDWVRAVAQARRQRYSADAAYVAVDAAAAPVVDENVVRVAHEGIGLLAVDAATQKVRVLARPVGRLGPDLTRLGRILIAERCLAMRERGVHEGQIYPVFGWLGPHGSD
jgi:hypothetical protein